MILLLKWHQVFFIYINLPYATCSFPTWFHWCVPLSLYISLSFILVPHNLRKQKKKHLVMYDISNKLTCLLQIQQSTRCICMLRLQPEKIEKGIQLMWFALLPLISFTLELYHQKHSLSNRAFFTPSATWVTKFKFNFVTTQLSRSFPKGAWGPNP